MGADAVVADSSFCCKAWVRKVNSLVGLVDPDQIVASRSSQIVHALAQLFRCKETHAKDATDAATS